MIFIDVGTKVTKSFRNPRKEVSNFTHGDLEAHTHNYSSYLETIIITCPKQPADKQFINLSS